MVPSRNKGGKQSWRTLKYRPGLPFTKAFSAACVPYQSPVTSMTSQTYIAGVHGGGEGGNGGDGADGGGCGGATTCEHCGAQDPNQIYEAFENIYPVLKSFEKV